MSNKVLTLIKDKIAFIVIATPLMNSPVLEVTKVLLEATEEVDSDIKVPAIAIKGVFRHLVVIFGLISSFFLKFEIEKLDPSNIQFVLGNRLAYFLVILFFFILAIVFLLSQMDILSQMEIQENFKLFLNLYNTGALVFGGGHEVLPLLDADFVPTELLYMRNGFLLVMD